MNINIGVLSSQWVHPSHHLQTPAMVVQPNHRDRVELAIEFFDWPASTFHINNIKLLCKHSSIKHENRVQKIPHKYTDGKGDA